MAWVPVQFGLEAAVVGDCALMFFDQKGCGSPSGWGRPLTRNVLTGLSDQISS